MILQILPVGTRVKIAPSRQGFKSRSYTGTVMEKRKDSHVYWKTYLPVLRDGYEFPQMINCSRLSILDPKDDHLLQRGGEQGEPGDSAGEQGKHHVDHERHDQEANQTIQSDQTGTQEKDREEKQDTSKNLEIDYLWC